MEWLAIRALLHPRRVAVACVFIGVILGLFSQVIFGNSMFGRFGSVTVAFGVLTFGAATGDVIIYSSVGKVSGNNGLAFPRNFTNLRRVFKWQTIVVAVGTILWGFGDLVTFRGWGQIL